MNTIIYLYKSKDNNTCYIYLLYGSETQVF
jgi:hypothetical protein